MSKIHKQKGSLTRAVCGSSVTQSFLTKDSYAVTCLHCQRRITFPRKEEKK